MMKIKDNQKILEKLKISALNPMQVKAGKAITSNEEVMILSPTGTGKTLAFLMPLLSILNPDDGRIQAMVIVPSRELAIQIEQVVREMGSGFKANAVYGGRAISKDKMDIKHKPAILIGTPGRIADHLRRETISPHGVRTLILDEFDKTLEVGFEEEMEEIMASFKNLKRKILTSATRNVSIPPFVGIKNLQVLDFLETGQPKLTLKSIISPTKDKLDTLSKALAHLGNQPGIVFCNFRDSIERVSDHLTAKGILHGCFHGGMEQEDREKSLVQFRNGSLQLIVATDLAARGIDVPELKYIIHYHLPTREHEFIHRNGRTARMKSTGTAYVIKWVDDVLPDFIGDLEEEVITDAHIPALPEWKTVVVSGGRRDKISKGDIAGFFYKQGNLKKEELGNIELKQDCSFVAVNTEVVSSLVELTDNAMLKKKKVRVNVL
ncbi:DEAD/DEAH box helicase [Membranihabitans marinus]|uniref:DEAD/DEAH box helicase n=1 Tax=Membranihabitans marinus TaxID=1227546 RepID=UPI001F3F099B|nr:DEAD/DEAH box helicase [Membranihabitans marinus]